MKNILLFIIILAAQIPCRSQNLANSRKSGANTFVYKLTPQEARKIYQKGTKKIDSTLYHNFVASIPDGRNIPPRLEAGYYLRLRAQANRMYYELEPVIPFEVKVLKNNSDLLISVYDTTGKKIRDAECRMGLRRIPFDKKSGLFRISKGNCKGLLTVTHNGFDGLYYLEREKYNPAALRISKKIAHSVPLRYAYIPVQMVMNVPRDIYNLAARGRTTGIIYLVTKPFRDIYQTISWGEPRGFISSIVCIFSDDYCNQRKKSTDGFSAFSKPIYKPGDTLKAKFYILDHKKNPYGKELELSIDRTYPNYHKNIGHTKPYREGFYETEIVLHDSLKMILDKEYSLHLKNRRDRIIASGSFRYEEYKLKSMKGVIRSEKMSHYPYEPKNLFLEVMDENELNIPDARAEIVVRPKEVRYEEASHIFVPDILWKHQLKPDPVGETKIQIPDSVFPEISFGYEVEVLFLNSENETRTEKLQLDYHFEKEFIIHSLSRDTLNLTYLRNGNPLANIRAHIEEYNSGNRKIRDYVLQLPAAMPVNPLLTRYVVHARNILKTINLSDEQSLVQCFTRRTADSVFIHIENPRNLDLTYNIYCKNMELKRGNGKVLDFKDKTKTAKNYFLSLQYIWAGEPKNEEFTIPFNDKNLNVQIIHPKVVYPGQQTNMKILVTDQNGKPAENIDITAYANTAKFDDKIPAVPYLGKRHKGRAIVNNFRIKNLNRKDLSSTLDYSFWRDQLGLDTIEYYHFLYPEDGLYHSILPIKDGNTQFAPFVFRNGSYLPVRVIYLDNIPVYFGHANTTCPYSFNVFRPGFHHLRLRMYDSELILDSVYIAPNVKTVLSLDISKKNSEVKKISKPYKFTGYEKDLLERYTLYINTTSTDEKVEYIEQNGNYQVVKEHENRWNHNIIAGPVKPTMVTYGKIQDFRQPFRFEPGYTYEISQGLIKMRCRDKRFGFAYLSDYTEKSPAESQLTLSAIEQMWHSYLFNKRLNETTFRNPLITTSGKGKLGIHIENSNIVRHNLRYFLLLKADKPQFVRVNNIHQTLMHDLEPGYYRAVFIGDFQHFFEVDSLLVQPDGTSYYKIGVPEMLSSNALYKKIDSLVLFQLSFPRQQVHPRNRVFNDIVTEYHNSNRINLEGGQLITGRIT
ncbi:MAG: hypothetical protein JXB00_09815, partial [Bacteroidales bacterium]|nr:hypothetical protein [Bacteroidales bacterium]